MALIEELDDRTLVEQHRAGDDEAFRRIVERHHRSLYANALRRLGDPVLAEDAVQETFLRAFRNLGRFEGEYHLDAWLHRIVTNACHDIGRRQGRDSRLFDRACTAVEVEAPAADDNIEILEAAEVDRALDQLPASYREVLLLRFVDEMSYSDVAQKAGISEENARARVSRGRNMLKRMLSSTSALVLWAIPSLRRAQVADPDAASHAAQQVHNLTGITNVVSTVAPSGGLGQLSSLVAQSGPAIATATPAVASVGPAMKAAVAAGLAAAVAIPTGVAVDRAREKPQAQVAAPLADADEPEAPGAPVEAPAKSASGSDPTGPSGESVPVSALSSGGAVGSDAGAVSVTGLTTTTSSTPSTAAPAAPTEVPTGSEAPAPSAPIEEPTTTSPAEEEPAPAPAPAPAGTLSAGSLTVTEAGPRLELAGPISVVVGDRTLAGQLSGKVLVGAADAKDAQAPREIEGSLQLVFDDGTTADLRFRGTTVVTVRGPSRSHELTVVFRLEGGSALGLAESGDLTGTFDTRGETGSLTLALPGQAS